MESLKKKFVLTFNRIWGNRIFPIFSDMGVQLDGFPAVVAHTLVIGSSKVNIRPCICVCKLLNLAHEVVCTRKCSIRCTTDEILQLIPLVTLIHRRSIVWKKLCVSLGLKEQYYTVWIICIWQDNKVTGRKADVLLAAHYAAEAALRLVKPGNEVENEVHSMSNRLKCTTL